MRSGPTQWTARCTTPSCENITGRPSRSSEGETMTRSSAGVGRRVKGREEENRQGDKETGGQGDKDNRPPPPLVPLSPCPLVSALVPSPRIHAFSGTYASTSSART